MKTSTHTRFRRLAHSLAHSAALVLAAALLATALLATACTDPADGSPASTDALSFGASLLAPGNSGKHTADTRTRATAPVTKDAFTKGDRIAVSIDNQVKPYVYGTDRRFTATATDNSFYWTPGQQQQAGVIAWYPYSDELPSLSSPLNISRQDTDAAFAARRLPLCRPRHPDPQLLIRTDLQPPHRPVAAEHQSRRKDRSPNPGIRRDRSRR